MNELLTKAQSLLDSFEFNKAMQTARTALKLIESGKDGDKMSQAKAWEVMGLSYYEKLSLDSTEYYLQKSYDLNLKELGKDHPQTVETLLNLGMLNYSRKNFDKATKILNESLDYFMDSDLSQNHVASAFKP